MNWYRIICSQVRTAPKIDFNKLSISVYHYRRTTTVRFSLHYEGIEDEIGCLSVDFPKGPNGEPLNRAFIYNFTVLPDFRNSGLGSLFFNHIVNYLKNKGIGTVKLFTDTEGGKRFYDRFNFQQKDVIKKPYCDVHTMEKELRQ